MPTHMRPTWLAWKAEVMVKAGEEAGAMVIPLPPWSPDLDPIEEMDSKVKGAARTREAVYTAIDSALHDVSPGDVLGWFQDRSA